MPCLRGEKKLKKALPSYLLTNQIMRKSLSLLVYSVIFSLIFAANASAQPSKTTEKPRSAAEYQKVETKARKNLADKDEASVLVGQWQLAQLFADANAPQRNVDSAWQYVSSIDARFTKLKSEIKEKAAKKGDIDGVKLRKLKETVAKALFANAKKTATVEAYQNALNATEKAKEFSIKKSRDSIRVLFGQAVGLIADTIQTVESIAAFRQKFPVFAKENAAQNRQLDDRLFRLYFAKNGYQNAIDFCQKNGDKVRDGYPVLVVLYL